MILFKRFQPILSASAVVIALEGIVLRPEWCIYFWLGLIGITTLSMLWQTRPRQVSEFFLLIGSLWLLDTAAAGLMFFVEAPVWRHAIIAGVAVSQLVYLTNVFYYYFRTEKYQLNSLQNLSSYLNLAAIFMLAASAYSVYLYLGWATWVMAIVIAVLAWGVALQTMVLNQAELQATWIVSLACAVMTAQVFWAVSFWPSSPYVNAFVVTVVHYVTLNLSRYHVIDQLEKTVVWRYFVIGVSMLLLTVLTARWV